MAMLVAGDEIVSTIIKLILNRLSFRKFIYFIRGKNSIDALLKKLKPLLLFVVSVLNDAENKQITDPNVRKWLDELQEAVFDAEDVVDDIDYKALRYKLEGETRSKVRKFFCALAKRLNYGTESKLVEIFGKLENIVKQKDILGLKEVDEGKGSWKLPSTSLVEEEYVYGRNYEKEEIVKLVLDGESGPSDGISVIPIVGMGGIGKTTLAQLVYNDDRVKAHFEIRVWVCVSEEFDVSRVTKCILEAVGCSTFCNMELNTLQVELKQSLRCKKALLVLDDVWNENYISWEVLRKPLRSLAQGSKIIVTTRSENVASVVGTVRSYYLDQLSDEDCWQLFAKHAFGCRNIDAICDLEVIGKGIVKKCKGLPLAAKAIGGLLRCKVELKEWDRILKSEIWDLPNGSCKILPALMLSYVYLPSHLKRCFAYCSIFPKDYDFKEEELVLLWMAEDLLRQPDEKMNSSKALEDIGDEYFNDLVSRSFFQRSSGDNSCFIMHDLVNDLAKYVAGEFCIRLEGDWSTEILRKARHLSYTRTLYDPPTKFDALNEAKSLRTFLILNLSAPENFLPMKVLDDLLPRLRCLRMLSLSHYKDMMELPDSISKLKHLRYLDLSHTTIKTLPASICTLYHLQTLILTSCASLTQLPSNIGGLVNLRYLCIRLTNIKEMPLHISRLKNLRTLTMFVLGKNRGASIRELGQFQNLRGTLFVSGLQNVDCAGDALVANLRDKKHLKKLMLKWHSHPDDSHVDLRVREILEKLQPHVNLRKLTIKNYGGSVFPCWLGDSCFSNLVSLSLTNCRYCICLPPLGQLPSLKKLSTVRCDLVQRVDCEFNGNDFSTQPFKSLEFLKFEGMLEWEEWYSEGETNSGSFPCLRELHIENCPKLTGHLPYHLPFLEELVLVNCPKFKASLPKIPALCRLDLFNCDEIPLRNISPGLLWLTIAGHCATEFPFEDIESSSKCFEEVNVSNCPSLRWLLKDGLPLTSKALEVSCCVRLEFPMQSRYAFLESLSISSSCDSLKYFWLDLFPKLNRLHIEGCENLESFLLPHGHCQALNFLNHLQISRCPNFLSFPIGGLPAPKLTWFWVENCGKLKSLPQKMRSLLPSLKVLHISYCPELSSPEGGFPSKLSSLSIDSCEKLIVDQTKWNLLDLSLLRDFSISNCETLESFPHEGMLPPTLTSLYISRIYNLKSLNYKGIQHLMSLKELKIENCSKLQSMMKERLPSSLSFIRIDTDCLVVPGGTWKELDWNCSTCFQTDR